MSRGNEGRGGGRQQKTHRSGTAENRSENSKSSIKMTVERARAIQSNADRHEKNQDFKARAMAAAERNKRD